MEKLLVILVAILMMLGFSMVGFASDQGTMGSQEQSMPEKKMDHKEMGMTYRGEVASIDETAHTLVVKGKEGEKTFDVSQATMKGKVEPEHWVMVKYTDVNGKLVASFVRAVWHKASSKMGHSAPIANSQYAGIGEATRMGLSSGCC